MNFFRGWIQWCQTNLTVDHNWSTHSFSSIPGITTLLNRFFPYFYENFPQNSKLYCCSVPFCLRTPTLSTDLMRNHWDGYVSVFGLVVFTWLLLERHSNHSDSRLMCCCRVLILKRNVIYCGNNKFSLYRWVLFQPSRSDWSFQRSKPWEPARPRSLNVRQPERYAITHPGLQIHFEHIAAGIFSTYTR